MLIFGILTEGFGLSVLVLLIGDPCKVAITVSSLKVLFTVFCFFFLGLKKQKLHTFLIK